jgi:proteasome lid subunit RPN8/RPN11
VFRRLLARWGRRQAEAPRLIFARPHWDDMVTELGRRSLNGGRETGAFLLAPHDGDGKRVTRVLYLDDLDPNCLVGGIHFHGSGYSKLATMCEREQLRVVGDVHTHPGSWVGQSDVDRDNPMLALRGHFAVIMPDYSTRPMESHEVGIHEYRGEDGWKSSLGSDAAQLLQIEGS